MHTPPHTPHTPTHHLRLAAAVFPSCRLEDYLALGFDQAARDDFEPVIAMPVAFQNVHRVLQLNTKRADRKAKAPRKAPGTQLWEEKAKGLVRAVRWAGLPAMLRVALCLADPDLCGNARLSLCRALTPPGPLSCL